MKDGCFYLYLKAKHRKHINSKLEYFESLRIMFENRSTFIPLFSGLTPPSNQPLRVGYAIFYIAKHRRYYNEE